ncbi:FMN-binding protein [Streptomyces bauhiniae]|uniref:FMN-binding protein n=1 Tax=Streptomyces bauhiniae TaxID=2340725 RepID=A0A7K3QK79_9ACTN|nr:FMN-binding protein [Streptomyces bauhiniae]NEB90298.1 FMN-binding protein [Streptomyces bauhiniae]
MNQAVLATQNAEIDSVSGATYTSSGYKKSLQSALDQIKKPPTGGSSGAAQARTVTGSAEQTPYGAVQVRVTLSGKKITKAEAVQAPKGPTSDEKTALAVPRLNQAVLATQNAEIDSVSGATYTSSGYKKSLQSALDQIKKPPTGGSSGAAQARTVTGSAEQTPYGAVQVRVTLSGKKITKAEAVQAPKGPTSDEKTALAVPRLNQAAVTAGSAEIDSVSGATYTSTGYKKSLQSALDQAGG